MATDIPTPAAMGAELLIDLATQGIAAIFKAFHKDGAAGAVQAADALAMAILQKNAEIKGLTIDWTDPQAVLAYIQTLQDFVPIPEPGPAQPPIVQDKPATP